MCAAIGMAYDADYEALLQSYLSAEQWKTCADTNEIIFRYWDPIPILPVRRDGAIAFVQWGNRSKEPGLPPTGWARLESLEQNKWDYLHPSVVRIPAMRGYEKGTWFVIQGDIRGILIQYKTRQCVYMITQEATISYQTLTGHTRMPRFHEGQSAFSA